MGRGNPSPPLKMNVARRWLYGLAHARRSSRLVNRPPIDPRRHASSRTVAATGSAHAYPAAGFDAALMMCASNRATPSAIIASRSRD